MREKQGKTETLNLAVSGSYPEPAEAKLTPVISSSKLSVGSKYGGTYSLIPAYEAASTQPNQSLKPSFNLQKEYKQPF